MLFKSILATFIGAAVTGGAVYVAQNPQVMEPVQTAPQTAPSESAPVKLAALEEIKEETHPKQDRDSDTEVVIKEDKKEMEIEIELFTEPVSSNQYDDLPPSMEEDYTAQKTEPREKIEPSFIKTVMEQAKKIQTLDLRDQAYLDVVDYSIMRDEFAVAKDAMDLISNAPLRDTARNRIAVKYALNGDSDSAFGMVDGLENEALSDFIRLQVVQALIVPERLPQGVIPH